MNIRTLIEGGVLTIASLPTGNPQSFDGAEHLTVPLIGKDYPAMTAAMWNTAYRATDIPGRNMMMVADPKDVAGILDTFRADPAYRGGGAGAGFKEAVIPHLDSVTPLAKAMGAVNIIKKDRAGRLIGDNTDGEGYAKGLEQVLVENGRPLRAAHVLLLGAGGSGKAIAFALAHKGARLTILNRTESKAHELALGLNGYFGSELALGGNLERISDVLPSQHVVISVIDDEQSPLDEYSTLGPMALPVTPDALDRNREASERLLRTASPSLIVSDIRIRKRPTAMLAQARTLGFRTLNGIPMVVNQGVRAFVWVYEETLEERNIREREVASVMWGAVDFE